MCVPSVYERHMKLLKLMFFLFIPLQIGHTITAEYKEDHKYGSIMNDPSTERHISVLAFKWLVKTKR
jgi:hypothetical protein